MAQFLLDLGEIWTAVTGYFVDILGLFVSEPVLLITVGFFFIGGVIGLTMRLLRQN